METTSQMSREWLGTFMSGDAECPDLRWQAAKRAGAEQSMVGGKNI